ncbi:hypothetical protein EGI11_02505 [Chryseobacterium sp. H3056]|uniref:Uncharacterized protein n=1 Tax=Kaistella daneshvariae TaxID=2487074 RepID=A0A3N0X0C8_9FLAO|nr:hypothetical protein [Kaistella daneshvariae]ROI10782.1 hypothetical protein EGI11_02505 [Kaistella daneshvariae]
MEKIAQINQVIAAYFEMNTSVFEIAAKDLMPHFVKAGVFPQDQKSSLPIRRELRKLDDNNQLHLIPFVYADRKATNVNLYFRRNNTANYSPPREVVEKKEIAKSAAKTSDRDENYVLDLCDEVLDLIGSRQHRFEFLLGDAGTKLPVDIYYKEHNLVIEYREYQHTNAVKHFDKPDKMTVSGVHRGEQRKIYDQRRRDILPAKGIKLIEIDYTEFAHSKNRIMRDKEKDMMW